MALPLFTTVDDVTKICKYLSTKPTGTTVAEAKKVLGSSLLDHRKLSAMRIWRFVGEDPSRLKLTNEGRDATKNNFAGLPAHFREVIRGIEAYHAVIERALHNNEDSIISTDIASYWHDNFSDEVQSTDRGINDQAVCFFHVVQGAELGTMVFGRRGSPTRVDLDRMAVEAFVQEYGEVRVDPASNGDAVNGEAVPLKQEEKQNEERPQVLFPQKPKDRGVQRVFITHGKNKKIVEQLKELVTYGKLIPVIAEENETLSKPIPDKVMDDMKSCDAAIIHVSSEQVLMDADGKPHNKINENVLIEIGAAMALYKDNGRYNFILLVERGIQLPSNLQGLYQCRYEGDKLDMEATMKILKAFNEFAAN